MMYTLARPREGPAPKHALLQAADVVDAPVARRVHFDEVERAPVVHVEAE